MNSIVVTKLDILDWYDGWIMALIETENADLIGCVVAFDPGKRRRKYLLTAVAHSRAEEVRTIYNKDGISERFKAEFLAIFAGAHEILVTEEEAAVGKVIAVRNITVRERKRLPKGADHVVENAVSEKALSFWFGAG